MSPDPTPRDPDETLALPVTDPEKTSASADKTAALPVTDPEPAADETRPLPTTPAYTSPIGDLYTPTDRPDPVSTADAEAPVPAAPPRRLRMGTVVWGLVIAAIGVGLLAWAGGVQIDVQLAMIVLLAAAGVALLLGSIFSGARNARR
ncbi:hypothetical protein [uncultured Cellulomonas sp.]|uniref:hypothetical protein n=1 Tax=uncultured Cellulomonas sp. TaxID=189682 RepID=UPI0028E2DC78|nr:hypothetical protein [uncultured Cellulomonas sp.]